MPSPPSRATRPILCVFLLLNLTQRMRLTSSYQQVPSSRTTTATQTPTRSPAVLRSQTGSAPLTSPSRSTPPPAPTRTPFVEPHLPASRLVPLDVHGVLSLRDPVERECLEGELAARAFSYIIVGGGTAGLVLARRLSEDPENKVLVLEAGPMCVLSLSPSCSFEACSLSRSSADSCANRKEHCAEIEVPNMAGKLWHTAVDWAYHSVAQEGLHERRVLWPRGKVRPPQSLLLKLLQLSET